MRPAIPVMTYFTVVSRFLPLARRRLIIARPSLVDMRLRKPCLRLCFLCEGLLRVIDIIYYPYCALTFYAIYVFNVLGLTHPL
jgi:hypothetical protein